MHTDESFDQQSTAVQEMTTLRAIPLFHGRSLQPESSSVTLKLVQAAYITHLQRHSRDHLQGRIITDAKSA